MKLSRNFHLSEFTRSATASRHRIANVPGPCHIAALRLLAIECLQPVRDHFGPVSVSSGFRSAMLNSRVSRSATSQHLAGEAADFEVPGVDNFEVASWIVQSAIPFDQLILEHYIKGEPHSGWLHMSHAASRKQRGQVLTATVGPDGETKYLEGLVAD